MKTRAALLAVAASSFVLVAACGDDDEAAEFDAETWCAAVEVLDQAELPTLGQLEAYQDTAPAELDDEMELAFPTFADALETGDFEPLGTPEVLEATESMRAVEAEHCTDPG